MPNSPEPPKPETSRIAIWSGAALTLLTIAGLVLDLPKKAREAWPEEKRSADSSLVRQRLRAADSVRAADSLGRQTRLNARRAAVWLDSVVEYAEYPEEYVTLLFVNECSEQAVIAASYQPVGTSRSVTAGWWVVAPEHGDTITLTTVGGELWYHAHFTGDARWVRPRGSTMPLEIYEGDRFVDDGTFLMEGTGVRRMEFVERRLPESGTVVVPLECDLRRP